MNGSYGFGNAGKRARFLRVKKLPAGRTRERERARGSGESEIVVVLYVRWQGGGAVSVQWNPAAEVEVVVEEATSSSS